MKRILPLVAALAIVVPRAARADEDQGAPPRRDAAQVAQDGTFLPLTLSARVGDQRVAALAVGGYDTAQGQGAIGSIFVEGGLFRRVALRAGVAYVAANGEASPTVAIRAGLLRQEQSGIDLGIALQYQRLGFTEATKGELEILVLVGRRFGRLGLFGNLVYGQGFEATERDGEARLAALVTVADRYQVGVDARARIDLGRETPARQQSNLESDFDLLAGPVAEASVGPVTFLAQAGVHTLVQRETPHSGFAAIGGIGGAF